MGSSNTPLAPPLMGSERMFFVRTEEIPVLGRLIAEFPLVEPSQVRILRSELRAILDQRGVEPTIKDELLLAAGEAGTNACVHGRGGKCCVFTSDDRLIVRISDEGPGIAAEHLAQAVFEAGFSTAGTCGMGYTLMLALADRVWLATGPTGTIVQLEKRLSGDSRR